MKLIMENWRGYLNEDEGQGPTVGEFLAVWNEQDPKSNDLASFMVQMAQNQVPDDERTGIALYYDLDDDYEKLLQGMDSELAKEYQKHLYAYFKEAFEDMSDADPEDPLSKYIETTADGFLKNFLADKEKSGVGVKVAE